VHCNAYGFTYNNATEIHNNRNQVDAELIEEILLFEAASGALALLSSPSSSTMAFAAALAT